MTTFEDAKVGDRVWCLYFKEWSTITDIKMERTYPIQTGLDSYTIDGRMNIKRGRTLFWDEVVITPPEKPLPKLEVDTKVLVRDTLSSEPLRRYFSHFEKNGQIATFAEGTTSWSVHDKPTIIWEYWELAKD